jgi:hypothetical protein
MGYPESFKIVVSDTQAYRQFGNSVVVPVVERIAAAVVRTLRQPLNAPPDFALTAAEKPNSAPVDAPIKSVAYPRLKKNPRKKDA